MMTVLRDPPVGVPVPLSADEFTLRLWRAGPAVRDRLRAAVAPRLRPMADPDDVWQDTCVIAWGQRQDFRWQGRSAFLHWLLTIARRVVVHHARRQAGAVRGGAAWVSLDRAAEPAAGPGADPCHLALLRDEAAAVHRQVATLPLAQREVLLLSLAEPRAAAALARHLNKSVTTIHKHRYRALRALRRALAQPAPPAPRASRR